jgi:hypothetical protein
MYVYGSIEALSLSYFCSSKAKYIANYECVFVALGIQHAMRMSSITFPYTACPSLPYFSVLFHTGHDFRINVIQHTMCVLIFSTNFYEKCVILRIIQRDTVINVGRSSSKVPAVFVGF